MRKSSRSPALSLFLTHSLLVLVIFVTFIFITVSGSSIKIFSLMFHSLIYLFVKFWTCVWLCEDHSQSKHRWVYLPSPQLEPLRSQAVFILLLFFACLRCGWYVVRQTETRIPSQSPDLFGLPFTILWCWTVWNAFASATLLWLGLRRLHGFDLLKLGLWDIVGDTVGTASY